jgi:hypothetical protein
MSFREKILQGKPRVVEVTLKDGTPVKIKLVGYETAQRLNATEPDATDQSTIENLIGWIIAAVVEDDDSPAFKEEDRSTMKQVLDAARILELGLVALRANTPKPDEIEKNS